MALSDYRYKKARKLVKEARVSRGVKEMIFCGLRQYRNSTQPVTGTWQTSEVKKGKFKVTEACIAGAALVYFMKGAQISLDWFEEVKENFGIKRGVVEDIISGFDSTYAHTACSRVFKLADKLAIIVGAKSPRKDD